jgi:hypothetical protein
MIVLHCLLDHLHYTEGLCSHLEVFSSCPLSKSNILLFHLAHCKKFDPKNFQKICIISMVLLCLIWPIQSLEVF